MLTSFARGRRTFGSSPIMPPEVYVRPLAGAKSNVGWSVVTQSALQGLNGISSNNGVQNDEISFDVVLDAGTWTLELLHYAGTDRGIYSIYLDEVLLGTLDGYAAAEDRNKRQSLTGVIVGTAGRKTMKLKTATKHASASAYYAGLMLVTWKKTA